MGDNMQLMQLGNKYMTAINHSVLNFITTMDESFNDYSKKMLDNLAQKSTLISGVNQKERLMFFNRLRAKVAVSKKLMPQSSDFQMAFMDTSSSALPQPMRRS